MGEAGLEPAHREVPEPKSGASANSATRPSGGRATIVPKKKLAKQFFLPALMCVLRFR